MIDEAKYVQNIFALHTKQDRDERNATTTQHTSLMKAIHSLMVNSSVADISVGVVDTPSRILNLNR